MIKHFLFLTLIFSFLILCSACGRKPPEPAPPPPPPVNNFALKNLASEFPDEIRTTNYSGKVQLVLFFLADDAACRGSVPGWNALQKEFGSRGFTIVGAIADDRRPDEIAADVVALDAAWPVGLAEPPVVAAFGGPAAIRAIPTAFLLSREGAIVRIYPGYEPPDRLRDDIDRLLDGRELVDRNPKPAVPAEATP